MDDQGGDGRNEAELGRHEGFGDPTSQLVVFGVGEISDLAEDVDHPRYRAEKAQKGCGGGGYGDKRKSLFEFNLTPMMVS